jgi:hypothetical protein
MERAVTPDEFRPVTIDDVISPVPMNPSRMIFRFHKACTVFKKSSAFYLPAFYLPAFYPTTPPIGCSPFA